MRAGLLRHPVVIETATEARNAMGQVTRTWATAAGGRCYARIEPIRGTETLTDDQARASVSHKVTMRYTNKLTALARIRFTDQAGTSRYLHPVAPIVPDEVQESITALCTEHTDGAVE